MKYHNHIIKKEKTDLGEMDSRLNYTYKIFKNEKYIATALTLNSAKEFIDSNYNQIYL